jgi:hypothetical protein
MRFHLELAEMLHRTVDELLYGSGAFRPITANEMSWWAALSEIRAEEAEQQNR